MGFPMIQVFMIAARQVSKPVADAVLKYGKDHPVFRTRILIPVGRALVKLTTRLRMKRLGLGETVSNVQVSEAAALEQASDFVQQLVLFSYSCGVFASYYFYTVWTTPQTIKTDEFNSFKSETDKTIEDLRLRLENLEKALVAANVAKVAHNSASLPATTPTPRFDRISSLPIDSAVKVVLQDGSEFLIFRSGSSVGIEAAAAFEKRAASIIYRKKDLVHEMPRTGIVGYAERLVLSIFGRWSP